MRLNEDLIPESFSDSLSVAVTPIIHQRAVLLPRLYLIIVNIRHVGAAPMELLPWRRHTTSVGTPQKMLDLLQFIESGLLRCLNRSTSSGTNNV